MEKNVTPTTSHIEKHSLCSGMNKALHTWNFLGHHATLHYCCNPLRKLYPLFFLSVKRRQRQRHVTCFLKHQTEDDRKLHKHAQTCCANNSAEKWRQGEKICSVGKIKHLPLTGLQLYQTSNPILTYNAILFSFKQVQDLIFSPKKATSSRNASNYFCLSSNNQLHKYPSECR